MKNQSLLDLFLLKCRVLTYQAEHLEEALRCIAKGLAGYPPKRIKKELMDLYD